MDIPIEDLEAGREDMEDIMSGSRCARCGCATEAHFKKSEDEACD